MLCLILGGAAVHPCDKAVYFGLGFSLWDEGSAIRTGSNRSTPSPKMKKAGFKSSLFPEHGKTGQSQSVSFPATFTPYSRVRSVTLP
jgi:hypothetical protein